MQQHPSMDGLAIYEIKVQGRLDERWADWFSGLGNLAGPNRTVTVESGSKDAPITTLTAAVTDQAALRGILTKIWDLNLTLISVRRIEADGGEEKKDD